MMRALFGPHDWLGRHPNTCLAMIAVLICIAGAF